MAPGVQPGGRRFQPGGPRTLFGRAQALAPASRCAHPCQIRLPALREIGAPVSRDTCPRVEKSTPLARVIGAPVSRGLAPGFVGSAPGGMCGLEAGAGLLALGAVGWRGGGGDNGSDRPGFPPRRQSFRRRELHSDWRAQSVRRRGRQLGSRLGGDRREWFGKMRGVAGSAYGVVIVVECFS